jgi:peptide/nickel transport system substrate-binding protein
MNSVGRLFAAGLVAVSFAMAAPAEAADPIRIASPYSTTTLDPMRSAAAGNIETYGLLYARLIRRDTETGELEPGLAESWEVSDDGTSYTFTLRDARFSDGTAITAEDVAFSLERVRSDERSAYPAPLGTVESISATNDKTVEVKLKNAFAPFLGHLEIWNMGIVSKADVEARGEDAAFAEAPAVSGPYQVKEWKPNEKLVLEPNPNYWRQGHPKSDATVELLEVASADTRIGMLRAGEIDAVRDVPWSQIDALTADDSVDMRLEPSTVIYVALLNNGREPFSNTEARQAAGHALDREALTKAVTQGHATVANTTLPGALDFHDKSNPGIPYDVDKAKELLEKSGMAGREVTIMLTPSAANEQMALFMQAQWQAIGLKPKIEKVDGGAWWSALAKGEYDATPTWWFNETPDPDLAVRWSVCGTCGSESFYTFYTNPKVDELVEAGSRELDPDKRAEAYKEIQRITTEEVAQIPLYYAPNANAYSNRVQGLSLTSSLQWTLEDTTIE